MKERKKERKREKGAKNGAKKERRNLFVSLLNV